MLNRVVITGTGAITPLGNSFEEFGRSLMSGKSGAGPITHFDTSLHKTKFACEVKDFDPERYIDKKEVRKMDRFTQFALAAASQAIAESGIGAEGIDKRRIGVIWASGNGGISTFEESLGEFIGGGKNPRFNPFFIPKILVDIASGWISMQYGFHGINYTAVSACASSNSAIMDAFNYIRWGKATAMITGGSEAAITPAAIGGFNACKALSTRNEDPATASRPYDAERDGFVMGEGAGALVLESLDHAKARGAKILGEIVGCGMSADAYHLTASHPDGLGAKIAMEEALLDAGLTPGQIDYINTHGTSTPAGDIGELKAIRDIFGDQFSKVALSSTKSMTGHLLGAAGAVEALATLTAIREQRVPPTINTTNPDPEIPLGANLVLGSSQQRAIRYAMSNTFGFGGHNAIVIMKQYED